jgi:hypothetical protein
MSLLTQKQSVERVQAQIRKRKLPVNPELASVLETLERVEKIEGLLKAIYTTAKAEREVCTHCRATANAIEDSGLA